MGTIAHLFETGEQSALKGHFRNLVMLARVDGKIDPSEQKLLTRLSSYLSLSDEDVKSICNDEENYPLFPPVSKEERFERLIQLIEMVNTDGEIDHVERKLIDKYSIALGVDVHESEKITSDIISKFKNGMNKDEILSSIL